MNHVKYQGITYAALPLTVSEILRSTKELIHVAAIQNATITASELVEAAQAKTGTTAARYRPTRGTDIIVEGVGTLLAHLSYHDLSASYVEFRVSPWCPENVRTTLARMLKIVLAKKFCTTVTILGPDGERALNEGDVTGEERLFAVWGKSETKIGD